MSETWTKDNIKRLIVLIEGLPELWNVKSLEYKNKEKKQEAVVKLAEEFETTPAEISRKIHNLRTQLNNEMRKLSKKQRFLGNNANVASTWEYFDSLKFLSTSTKRIRKKKSMNRLTSIKSEEADINEKSNKLHSSNIKQINSDSEEIFKQALTLMSQPEDDAGVFGAFVASSLRNLKKNQSKKKMKRLIQRIILEIEEQEDSDEELLSSIPDTYMHDSS